jgi:hypothetical protein
VVLSDLIRDATSGIAAVGVSVATLEASLGFGTTSSCLWAVGVLRVRASWKNIMCEKAPLLPTNDQILNTRIDSPN